MILLKDKTNFFYWSVSLQMDLRLLQTSLIGTSTEAERLASCRTCRVDPSWVERSCWVPSWRSLSGWITALQQSENLILLYFSHKMSFSSLVISPASLLISFFIVFSKVFNLLSSSVRVTIDCSETCFNPGQSFMVQCGKNVSLHVLMQN